MTHGGKRAGAGRPRANIDDKRVMVLRGQGITCPAIALRFGVPLGVVQYSILKSKRAAKSVNPIHNTGDF